VLGFSREFYSVRRAAFFAITAICIVSQLADAQEWPARPVKVIVPNGAGGVSDIRTPHRGRRFSKYTIPSARHGGLNQLVPR
jgi:tripartite-type tricarboxylate transporter receptor subunit TctC